MAALAALWEQEDLLREHRCIVVTGAEPAFCAGADATLLRDERAQVNLSVDDELSFLPGARVDVPVIAAVNGVCAGGGLHFVADADIAICSERASFLDPHVSVGQVTALEPISLALRVRLDVLTRMALLGRHERLDPEQALAAGLVSEVVPHERLLPRALELAEQIAANSPAAVATSRRAIHRFRDRLLAEAMQEGWDSIRAHWEHPDATEGPTAFIERREPRWQPV
jgi:enoyl-CoA hydratase/carnithine racemase